MAAAAAVWYAATSAVYHAPEPAAARRPLGAARSGSWRPSGPTSKATDPTFSLSYLAVSLGLASVPADDCKRAAVADGMDLRWLHIPKTGTSFCAVLTHHVCPELMEGVDPMSLEVGHSCVRCVERALLLLLLLQVLVLALRHALPLLLLPTLRPTTTPIYCYCFS